MRALSIRQPYAELILRGIKRIEYRSRLTHIVGERFWIYASKGSGVRGQGSGDTAKRIWSDDLAVTHPLRGEREGEPPAWMLELAQMLIRKELPSGVIVGSAVVEKVTRGGEYFEWHLGDVERASRLRKPKNHPQPTWFNPF